MGERKIIVRPFEGTDTGACAALLASGQNLAIDAFTLGQARSRAYGDPRHCCELLEGVFSSHRCDAVVAESKGRVVAFLAGERQMFGPEEFASIYAEPRSVSIPLHGYSIAPGLDVTSTYAQMYAVLAARWVGSGLFVHNVGVAAEDAAALEAWSFLGFGRKSVCALRPAAEPVTIADNEGETVIDRGDLRIECLDRECDQPHDNLIDEFHRKLMTYQAGAPMFWPYNGEADAAVAELRGKLMNSGRGQCLIAWQRDKAVGMILMVPAIFISPLFDCPNTSYLWEGFVDSDARSCGVGSALLSKAMQILLERGRRWSALHFIAANRLGARFWLGEGYSPVEFTMRRHVDQRVSWANRRLPT